MKLQKDEIEEVKKVRGQIIVLEELIEEMGQNITDTFLLGKNEEVNLRIWDCLYGNSTVESFVKFYNNKLKNEKS